jgi:hypothetical protein
MTVEITTPDKEEMYQIIDDHCNSMKRDFQSAKRTFIRLCRLISEKGYPPDEVWQRIKENLKDEVPKSTLYLWGDEELPGGAKKLTKPKKIPTLESPKQETKPELPNNDWLYNRIDVLQRENATLKARQIPTAEEQPEPKEIQGVHNIAPEEYKLEELDQYGKDLLINIIKYLHNEVQTFRKTNTTPTPSSGKQDWLLGK